MWPLGLPAATLVAAIALVLATPSSAAGQATTGLIQFAVFSDPACPGPVGKGQPPCLSRPARVAIRAQAIGGTVLHRDRTAKNGRGLVVVPAGDYQVWALRPNARVFRPMERRRVTVAPGGTTDVILTFRPLFARG